MAGFVMVSASGREQMQRARQLGCEALGPLFLAEYADFARGRSSDG